MAQGGTDRPQELAFRSVVVPTKLVMVLTLPASADLAVKLSLSCPGRT